MTKEPPTEPVRLDGRKLEGGGQLVRIAIALSALTGKPIAIEHIRGNRSGKKGLKASHLAAVKTLGELSGSALVKAQVGSCSLGFYPPSDDIDQARRADTEINIRLPTPGSVFLVFQALYPYLLHSSTEDQIRLSIIGGTNVSSSPSYDYVSQVLIPNFARVGLPPLSVRLEKRGWSAGHGQVQMGKVMFVIDPLLCGRNGGTPSAEFPSIDLHGHQRGKISQIDITILAPDDHLVEDDRDLQPRGSRHDDQPVESDELGDDQAETVRKYLERQVHKVLRKRLKELPSSVFSPELNPEKSTSGRVPIQTHTTEATHSRSCMYVLLVAHTSNGFKIGRDALYGSLKVQPEHQPKTKKRQGKQRPREDMTSRVNGLVTGCVENFIQELYDPQLQTVTDPQGIAHQPCVDEYMRDQLVVFEALGNLSITQKPQDGDGHEDVRYWSLHTQTAQWVCRQMLGGDALG
ncbi:RNA 3'-terminal phosphate cyclase domain-containing protein [Aspergillus pseudoustus]|uniref:RNA 3'-terminal phosphate cyclase domain-containing protein n=1 Tax=Aspergillus pseudoustus TaxID=1810923 RepID=A0ABR4J661_9EURO